MSFDTIRSLEPVFVPGERWGAYVLDQRIAVGGMAEVFRARRVGPASFARQVCLKRMHGHLSQNPNFRDLFLDEALLGAKLRHKNIVAIEDLGEHAGRYFLAMEYVHGVDLFTLRRRTQNCAVEFPVAAAIFIGAEILAALHAAHTAVDPETGAPLGVVHRDVTPHNVLVGYSGQVKLTDFGVARARGGRRPTEGRLVCGKASYMPMEQAMGKGVAPSSDLFALGVTLYELLAGRRPYCPDVSRASLPEMVAAQQRDERVPLASLRPDLPTVFAATVDAMLMPRLEDRIPSAIAALRAFESLSERFTGITALGQLLARLYPGEASISRIHLGPVVRPAPRLADRTEVSDDTPTVARAAPASDHGESAEPLPLRHARPTKRGSRSAAMLAAFGAVALGASAGRALAQHATDHATALLRPIPLHLTVPLAVHPEQVAPAVSASPPIVVPPAAVPVDATRPVVRVHHTAARHAIATHVLASNDAQTAIRVVVLPWGEVSIDDQPAVRAPVLIPVAPGEHRVRVTGATVATERVSVDAGQTRVIVVGGE